MCLGFVLYIVTRECIFCIHLRHICLTAPFYTDRLSARTILVTGIPHPFLQENKLRTTFGSSVRRVWIPRDTDDLQELVNERHQTAMRLEKAELQLIRMANRARSRALGLKSSPLQRTKPDPEKSNVYITGKDEESPSASIETPMNLPDVSGSVAAQWISHRSRPTHRPLANALRRTDTIKWTRNRLRALAKRILKERLDLLQNPDRPIISAAFIEFASQSDAQMASQALSYHEPLYMSERYAGVRPYEVVWPSLAFSQVGRMSRKFAMQAFIAVLVIFWSLPCAFIGMVSNIESLSKLAPFLGWIMDLPGPILGVLTGLVPALALAWLMSIVPWILRSCARVAGTPTLSMIEVYTQKSYIIFQIVQVFLVTTLTSAVSAALTQILENPMSATTLLSQNLPKSSNFYISYILIQALVIGSAGLVRFIDILRFCIFPLLPHNYRKEYERFHRLQPTHWGAIFPVFTNLGIIGISYACIAPVILAFATIGMAFLYFVYRYLVMYVLDTEVDTRGLLYPAALMQLIWGLYIAEICLIGLFSLKAAVGPIAMTAALLIVTVLVHRALLETLGPLLFDLPKSLAGSKTEETEHTEESEPWSENPFQALFAEIAEDDGPEHLPGAARTTSAAPQDQSSSTSTYRYTIASEGQHKIVTATESDITPIPNQTLHRANTAPTTSRQQLPANASPQINNTIRKDAPAAVVSDYIPDSTHNNIPSPTSQPRALHLPSDLDTPTFRLEGLRPLLRTFLPFLSTTLIAPLKPHLPSLTPFTTHPHYLTLRNYLSTLHPLYYASSASPIPAMVAAQLKDKKVPRVEEMVDKRLVYLHPCMSEGVPVVGVPVGDAAGVGRQEVEHIGRLGKGTIKVLDEGEWCVEVDEGGRARRRKGKEGLEGGTGDGVRGEEYRRWGRL